MKSYEAMLDKSKIGTMPGTYDAGTSDYKIRICSYNESSVKMRSTDEERFKIDRFLVAWKIAKMDPSKNHIIIINDYFDDELLTSLKETLGIHSLTMEDLVNMEQRCKYEEYETYSVFMITKFRNGQKIQISLIAIGNCILIFDPFTTNDESVESVLKRIVNNNGRIRGRDIGYATYAFMDAIVDSYFVYIELLENEQDKLDEIVETSGDKSIPRNIFDLKRKVLEFKKTTWPLREMMNSITRDDKSFMFRDDRNILFYRDLQDHVLRITESADALRDSVYSLVEMHMNVTSIRMNEVMKVLTVITTIFTPIMFVASIYGMNFDGMPEIHISHRYSLFWIGVVILSGIQLYYFKRKKWL